MWNRQSKLYYRQKCSQSKVFSPENQWHMCFQICFNARNFKQIPCLFRIERLWRDVWVAVTSKYYNVLHSLEEDGLLDISDVVHLFGVHYIFLPRIKVDLNSFIGGWNNHPLRTAGNLTPDVTSGRYTRSGRTRKTSGITKIKFLLGDNLQIPSQKTLSKYIL